MIPSLGDEYHATNFPPGCFLELGLDPEGLRLSFSWLGTSPWSFSKVFVDMPTLDVSELNIVLAVLGEFVL